MLVYLLNGLGYGSTYFQVTLHCDLCFLRAQQTRWQKWDAADSDKSRFAGLTCYCMLQLSLKCRSSISDLSWGSVRCSQKEAPVSVWCLPLSSCLPPVRLCPVESHTHESSSQQPLQEWACPRSPPSTQGHCLIHCPWNSFLPRLFSLEPLH